MPERPTKSPSVLLKVRRRTRGRPPHPDVLTPAEWSIFLRVRDGLSNGEIAQIRHCRPDTVKYHVANIVAKLEVADRDALLRWDGRPLAGEAEPGIDLGASERKSKMTTATVPGTFTGVAPSFLVDDVARTADWYRDHLGFEIGDYFREDHYHQHRHEHTHDHAHEAGLGEQVHAEPETHTHSEGSLGEPVFVILRRNGQRLLLMKTVERGRGVLSNRDFKEHSADAYFYVDGVEQLFDYVKATGATFVQELQTQFYGMREFLVRDCDGRVLTFGGEA